MEARLERLYARLGRRYLTVYVTLLLAIVLAMTAISVLIAARYEGFGVHEFWRTLGLIALGAPVVSVVAWQRLRRREPALFGWVAGDHGPAQAAAVWSSAVTAPGRTSWTVLRSFPPIMLPLTILSFSLQRAQTPLELVMLVLGAAVGIAYCVGAHQLLFELALRPLLRDAAGHLPSVPEVERGTIGLGQRLFLGLFAVGVVSGTLAGGVETPFGSGADTLLRDFAIVVAACASFSLVISVAVTASILLPTRDLLGATRRVGAGELDARVSVVTDDAHARLAHGFNRMVEGLRQREALRNALGSYVDPAIVDRVTSEGVVVRGQAAEVTVMFADIVGFTRLAEDVPPEEIVADLNEFFATVIPVIERHGGHANKLLGDGLMAVFGVPVHHPDHADRAVAAACEIQARLAERYAGRLRVGIGLNSGTVVAGSMGGGGKLDYTIVGDAVNVASRVEAHTRDTGEGILMTEDTRARLAADGLAYHPLGPQWLRGRSGPVVLYGVSGAGGSARTAAGS